MAIQAFDLIARLLFDSFGSGLLVAAFIIFFFILMMVVFRAEPVVILIVLIPLIMGFILNIAYTNFLEIPIWIGAILWIIAGFIFSLFFLFFLR